MRQNRALVILDNLGENLLEIGRKFVERVLHSVAAILEMKHMLGVQIILRILKTILSPTQASL